MEWKKVENLPKEKCGWFSVAILPRNHSGSGLGDETKLEGDNLWRKSFGFTKAWFNNGEWFEANMHGHGSNNITELVTHWDYLPNVPILTETFTSSRDYVFDRKLNKEQVRKLSMEQWEANQKSNPSIVNPEAFSCGFMSAMKLMGII